MGLSAAKISALDDYAHSELYSEAERVALRYADAITMSDDDVSDELFASLREHYSDDAIVDLTALICWENFSSKFNRAFRIEAQGLWDAATA